MKDYILFDLDGTLTDPGIGITNSVAYALNKFGILEKNKSKLFSFIGPPLYDSFRNLYGLSHNDANLAISYYREYYSPKGIFENSVYDNIPQMLSKLKLKNKVLVLATSKPEKFALQILHHFDLYKYFNYVFGATMDEKRNRKDAIIKYALKVSGIPPENAIMVGDRCYDIEGAHNNNLISVGVLYGYGCRKELLDASADFLAENVEQLENILIR